MTETYPAPPADPDVDLPVNPDDPDGETPDPEDEGG